MNKLIADKLNLLNGKSLKARSARGVLILGAGTVVEKGLAFACKMILTRLLAPELVGVAVIVFSLTTLFEAMTEVGIKQSVIHNKRGAEDVYLNMAWWFQCVRGSGLYLMAFLLSPLLCRFYFDSKADILVTYGQDELVAFVRVAFLSVLFNGFICSKVHVLEKEFNFGKSVFLIQGSGILGAIATIVFVLISRSIWAIVIGFALTAILKCVFSFVICPFMPSLKYDKQGMSDLLHYARGMLGSPILAYVAMNIDVLVAGRLLPIAQVGMYGMAIALCGVPREFFARIVSPVLFPAFSEKQDDKQGLCSIVLKVTKYSMLFLMPGVVLVVMCSKTILSVIFPDEYASISVPFSLICVCVLFLLQGVVLTSVFFAIGHPGKHRAFVGLRALLLTFLIYPAIKKYGLTGAAASVLVANAVALLVQIRVLSRTIGMGIPGYIASFSLGVLVSIPVTLVVAILRYILPSRPLLHLSIGIVSLCICVIWMFFKDKGLKVAIFNNG